MRAASSIFLGAAALTGLAFSVISGRLLAPLVAISILVAMGCLVALTTGVRSAR